MQTLESNIPGTISNQLMYTLHTQLYSYCITEFMTYHNIHSYYRNTVTEKLNYYNYKRARTSNVYTYLYTLDF